jgi:DNA-directed RNA polymerase specialized sigma24 family protein
MAMLTSLQEAETEDMKLPQGPEPKTAGVASLCLAQLTAAARRRFAAGVCRVPPQLELLMQAEVVLRVRHALLGLSWRTRLILAMRFGIGPDPEEHTLQEIAGEVGLSKERVRQIEKEGKEALSRRLGSLRSRPRVV